MAKAKAEAWKWFSRMVREEENHTCFTCGTKLVVDKEKRNSGSMQAGHFQSRRHNATLFMRANVHCQCYKCNIWDYGNSAVYAIKLKEKYGEKIIEKIVRESQKIKQFSIQELKFMAKTYKEKYEFLLKDEKRK